MAVAMIRTCLAATLLLALGTGSSLAGPTKVTREAVDKAVAEIEKAAQGEIDEKAVPGLAIAIVFDDTVIYAKGFGVRDVNTGAPVDADTVFQLASVSKPIGSTVVARLVGEGKIRWDSRIADLDPTFAMQSPWVTSQLTIRDLYAHRSGLPDHWGDLHEDLGYTREETLASARFQTPSSSFRAGYAYTNFGMTEGGIAAVKPTGLSWEDASEQLLYAPLGMSSTSSRHADFVARKDKALGHVLVDGKWVQKYQRDPDTESPAGGVSSSVNDLAKWIRLQLNEGMFDGKQIVDKAALTETHLPMIMTNPKSLSGIPQFYGLGWNVGYEADGRRKISHSGAFALGAGTNVNLSLDDGLGIVVLTNAAPTGVAEALAAQFLDIAINGKTTQEWLKIYKGLFAQMEAEEAAGQAAYQKAPANPMPAAPEAAYVGSYRNDLFGEIEVAEKDGGLVLIAGPRRMTFAMTHFDRDAFTYVTEGESAVGKAGILFALGPDGKARSVTVTNLDLDGQGTFVRKTAD